MWRPNSERNQTAYPEVSRFGPVGEAIAANGANLAFGRVTVLPYHPGAIRGEYGPTPIARVYAPRTVTYRKGYQGEIPLGRTAGRLPYAWERT
jgi:hypothetical protein